MKRSVAADGQRIPLHLVAARANQHDSPLLEPTLAVIVDMIGPCRAGEGGEVFAFGGLFHTASSSSSTTNSSSAQMASVISGKIGSQ